MINDWWQQDRDRRRRMKAEKRRDGSMIATPLGAPITMQVSLPTGQVLERAHLRLVDTAGQSQWQAESTLTTPATDVQKRDGQQALTVHFDVPADEEEQMLCARSYEFAYTVRQSDGQRWTLMGCGKVAKGYPTDATDLTCVFVSDFSDLERRALFPAAALFSGDTRMTVVQRTAEGIRIAKCVRATPAPAAPIDSPAAPTPVDP